MRAKPSSPDAVDDAPRLAMSIPQCARALDIDRSTAYRMLRSGVLPIPIIHFGGVARVRVRDVEAFLEQLVDDSREKPTPAANGHPAGVEVSRRGSRGSSTA